MSDLKNWRIMDIKDECPECGFTPHFNSEQEKIDYVECVWCGCDLTGEKKNE